VRICDEGLKKVCDERTVGRGEEICKTHYETTCETRFKEHGIEQDVPVCEMVTQRRCNGVLVPVPNEEGEQATRLRRQADEDEVGENSVESDKDLLSIGEECEEWPVQKCTVQKKVVKKVNPDTSCRKVPREICAPSNCVFTSNEKVCRDETRQLVQNIPSEECDLEPREECRMETVLVPRLIQKPNCIKVPKEICVNVKANPRKVRCINKVMQVETTVYEDKVKCQHTFTEKCHDTFITDYTSTQEKKCEQSFEKNCHITYRPPQQDSR